LQNPFDPGFYESDELREMGFASIGSNVRIQKNCSIFNLPAISIGSHVRIDSGTVITAGDEGVRIRNYVHIGAGSFLGARFGITMHDFSAISQGVKIYSGSDDFVGGGFANVTVPREYLNPTGGRVTIEKQAIVGSGSVILPGVTLKEGSSVGSLSVIRRNTKPWTVYLGNPAKPITLRKVVDPDGSIEKALLAGITGS